MVHRLTWFRSQDGDAQLREFFISALLDIGVSLTLQDGRGDYVCITTLPPRWTLPKEGEPTDTSIFGQDLGERLIALKENLRMPGDKAEIEVLVPEDCAFDFRCRMIQMADGATYLMTTVVDRTEERRRERLLRALLREVSHRSKNLLAIIQSIAFQTARYSGTLEGFLNKFRGRLHSLSQSQDLITDSSWRGAYFQDLLAQQVEKYIPDNRGLVHFSGDNILLSPNASLHIGLALHELAVNAVSHGIFLRQQVAIQVTCHRSSDAEGDVIVVTWTEPFSPRPEAGEEASKPKFGSTVLERVVPASVNGQASLEFTQGRLRYELRFPVEAAD